MERAVSREVRGERRVDFERRERLAAWRDRDSMARCRVIRWHSQTLLVFDAEICFVFKRDLGALTRGDEPSFNYL